MSVLSLSYWESDV